jgi:hypothetical protein
MAQSRLNDLSQLPPQEPAPKRYGVWFWIKQTFLLPGRLAGLFLVLGIMVGGPQMWVIPDLAERHKVDMLLLVLRNLDEEGAGRPFRRLGYQEKINSGLLDLHSGESSGFRPTANLEDKIVAVNPSRSTSGEVYVVRYASGQTQQLAPTTPHTTVPPGELAAARRAINRLFPARDRRSAAQVSGWGESLFVTSWVQKYDFKVAPRDVFPGPVGGTEDEQLWCAWQVLRCGGAPEEDLFHLPELFRATFPAKEDQKTALAWANTLYERLENYFRLRQRVYAASKNVTIGTYTSFQRVMPPDTEWSRLWLLQQYVGLSPAARDAARQRWLGYFPAKNEEQVLALGTSLAEERRAKGEPLPNVSDVLPVLCVIERLTGTDGEGQACITALSQPSSPVGLNLTLHFAYPNDDLYYVLASGDKLALGPLSGDERGTDVYYVALVMYLLFMTTLVTLGIQTAIQWFAARLFLRKSTRPLWEKHLAGRGEEPWYLTVAGIVLLAGVGCLTAPFSIAEMIAVQIGSLAQLYFGALLATACGGILIASFRRLAALFLVAFGVDIEETWADEILGILLGALVLYHFGNDLIAITLFALSDFLPGLLFMGIHRLLYRRRHTTPVVALAPAPARVAPVVPAFPVSSGGGRRWPS